MVLVYFFSSAILIMQCTMYLRCVRMVYVVILMCVFLFFYCRVTEISALMKNVAENKRISL